jgi:hypothetical protein
MDPFSNNLSLVQRLSNVSTSMLVCSIAIANCYSVWCKKKIHVFFLPAKVFYGKVICHQQTEFSAIL